MRGPLLGDRHDERERASLTGGAREPELAAEQARQLAADRQAEARAAVLAAGRAVGLLEGLEDDLLLVRRDADAGIDDRERDRRRRERRDHELHLAFARELEGVGEQVLEDLLQPRGVGADGLRQPGLDDDAKAEL